MNVLTDEEIDVVTDKQWDGIRGREIAAAHRAYARAIEAVVIKRLAAGVSVEPTLYRDATGNMWDGVDLRHDEGCTQLFTTDQLNTAIAAARVQENERCLAMMDAIGCDWRDAGDMAKFYATNYLREAIRALPPQADSQPAPLREGEWINDAGRIKWLMWRVQDLEAKLAARAPADSVLEDAAREAIEKVLALFPFNALIQKFSVNNGPCLTADNDDEFYSVKRVLAFLTEIKTTLDAARKQGANHD